MYFTQNICISHITIISPIAMVLHTTELACGATVKALHLMFCFAHYSGMNAMRGFCQTKFPKLSIRVHPDPVL